MLEIESVPEGRYPPDAMVHEMFKKVSKRYIDVSVSNLNCRIKLKVEKKYNIGFNSAF